MILVKCKILENSSKYNLKQLKLLSYVTYYNTISRKLNALKDLILNIVNLS